MITDRRKHERFSVDFRALYRRRKYLILSEAGKAAVKNISIGGAFLLTERDTPDFIRFQQIKLTINLPNSKQVRAVAEIIKFDESNKLHLKFVKITKQDRSVLMKFIGAIKEEKELFKKKYFVKDYSRSLN